VRSSVLSEFSYFEKRTQWTYIYIKIVYIILFWFIREKATQAPHKLVIMPETEVEQQPAVTEEATKDKQEIMEEEKKAEEAVDGSEKKDDEKKEDKAKDEEKKAKKEKKKKEPKEPAPPPPPPVHKKDFEKDVVYLFQFPRCPTLPNISPKCLKVETWLKMHGIKYENVNHGGKLRSKRGLLPFVELNGEEMSDPESILKTLASTYGKEMDSSLSSEQKNIQHAMLNMVDNHLHGAFLYWASSHAEDIIKGYKLNLQHFTGYKVPNPLLTLWFKYQYNKKGLKRAKGAGFAGMNSEEAIEEGKRDLEVLRDMLGDKQFFFGDEPHTLDLVTFSQLAQIINVEEDVKCPLKDYLNSDCENLVGLYNRMKDRTWGEHWEEAIGEKLDLNPHIPKPEPPKEEEKKEEEKKEEDNKKEEDKEKGDKDEKEKEEKKEDDEKKE